MLRATKTRLAALTLMLATLGLFAAPLSSAGAATTTDPALTVWWNVDASTHLKKLNQTVVVPRGIMLARIDLATGDLAALMALPKAKSNIKLAGLPLATATFKMQQVGLITGHVDLTTFTVTATAQFNIQVVSLYAVGGIVPVNLVGNSCTTSQPVTVTMSGPASLTGPSTFTGTYTIPSFKTCGLATTALTLGVSGPGNTFTATASPPPPAA
jgi:hypothetical protein